MKVERPAPARMPEDRARSPTMRDGSRRAEAGEGADTFEERSLVSEAATADLAAPFLQTMDHPADSGLTLDAFSADQAH